MRIPLCYVDDVGGTKGGRPRDEAFDKDESTALWQRDVLERAKVFALKHPKGKVARVGFTLRANARHFYYQMGKFGITKKQLGVTPHGLRHQCAARWLREETGMEPPNSPNAQMSYTEEEIELLRRGMKIVSGKMGHARTEINKAYVGSKQLASRHRTARVND